MKILLASDSFKGSLSSGQIIGLLRQAVEEVFPGAEAEGVLMADGGEGTMEAVAAELRGQVVTLPVEDPLGRPVQASYGLLPGGGAIIEMAKASGLPLVPGPERDPMRASSYGTGQLIRDALDRGIRQILVAVGGSATNDGGMGALSALGVRFLDQNGVRLRGCGAELGRVRSIDLSGLHPAARQASFTVMCDVTNPLLGPDGASRVFGPQKGATPAMVEQLEEGMAHYAARTAQAVGTDAASRPGAGAAGGLGFGLMAYLDAVRKPGVETVLDLVHFDEKLRDADLVITGEGRLDRQSSFGKVLSGVGERCRRAGVPAAAVVGGLLEGYEEIYRHGITGIVTTVNGPMTLEEAMARSEELYLDAARRLLRAIRCGMEIQGVCGPVSAEI